jgi:hypothetical protein
MFRRTQAAGCAIQPANAAPARPKILRFAGHGGCRAACQWLPKGQIAPALLPYGLWGGLSAVIGLCFPLGIRRVKTAADLCAAH